MKGEMELEGFVRERVRVDEMNEGFELMEEGKWMGGVID